MEPHTYILDLMYKFNQRTGANYDPSRGYNIMQCHVENKIQYYPKDFNKYDWIIGLICKNYLSNTVAMFDMPSLPIYSPQLYAFIILDYFNVTTYEGLFNAIRYDLVLNSVQIRQLRNSSDLKELISELCKNSHKYVGANKIFDALTNTSIRTKKPLTKRLTRDMDELESVFKTIKLE